MEEKEISLQDLLNIVLGRIRMIILLTVIFGAAGYCAAKFVMTPKYTSSIKIYVTGSNLENRDNETGLSVQEQQAAKNLAATCIVILDDVSVYEAISDKLLEDYAVDDLANYFSVRESIDPITGESKLYIPTGQIKKLINITAINNTEVLQVTCTTEVPKFSADICMYISELAPALITRTVRAGSVETVSEARVPSAPSGPNVKKFTALGAFAGMALAVFIAFILSLLDNTVSTGEDIKERFNIPVLAEIPDIFMDEKGGSGKYGS